MKTVEDAASHAPEGGGARRILNDYSFFSAPQLKRDPLGSKDCKAMSDQLPLPPDRSAEAEAEFKRLPPAYQQFVLAYGGAIGERVRNHVVQLIIGIPGGATPASEAQHGSGVMVFTGKTLCLCTAQHVVAKYRERRRNDGRVIFQAGNVPFDPEPRILFESVGDDLIVLRMNGSDQAHISALTWICSVWPPPSPVVDEYVAFAGLPTAYRINEGAQLQFAIVGAILQVISASGNNFKCYMARDTLISARGPHVPPPGTNFGGMSGGPVFRLVDGEPALCGIITDFGQSLEVYYMAPLALAVTVP